MIEKVGDSGSIGTNVKNFIAEGYIAQKNEETFRLQVEAGHAGMHRNYVPTKEELDVLLNITESLIETVYVNPHQAKTLKEIPPRPCGVRQASAPERRGLPRSARST